MSPACRAGDRDIDVEAPVVLEQQQIRMVIPAIRVQHGGGFWTDVVLRLADDAATGKLGDGCGSLNCMRNDENGANIIPELEVDLRLERETRSPELRARH